MEYENTKVKNKKRRGRNDDEPKDTGTEAQSLVSKNPTGKFTGSGFAEQGAMLWTLHS